MSKKQQKTSNILKFEDFLSDDITKILSDDEHLDGYVVDQLVSITLEEPTSENVVYNMGKDGDDIKKGQYIYLTCMFRKKGTTSFSSPSIQGVIKCRVVDMFKGTQYLNKIK